MNINPYIDEILYQIEAAHQALKSSDDLFISHHRFLIHCAVIHKILFPSKHYLKEKEKNIAHQRERELSKYFACCKDINDSSNVQRFRNHFEHLDIRMDDFFKHGDKLIIDKNVFVGNSDRCIRIGGQPLSEEYKFRNFENGKLTFMGEEFDTKEAIKWINAIKDYIVSKKRSV